MATKVSPSTFRAWMEDFGEQVFRKLYKKLEYKLWQPLYLWSKSDDEWEEIEINHYYCPDMLFIVPRHNDMLPFLLMSSFGVNLNSGGNCSCHKNK